MNINMNQGRVPDPGIEQMTICTPEKTFIAVRSQLSPAQILAYNAFVDFVTNDFAYITIENNPFAIDIDRVTSEIITQGQDIIDYNNLSQQDKTIIDNFNNLIAEL